MGTRSLTRVHQIYNDTDEILVNMYRQFDGYPDGHGLELAEFLEGKTVGNGIRFGEDTSNFFNGAGCLAAQLVANFKNVGDAGGFYLYPADVTDCGQEYEYDIFVENISDLRLTIKECYGNGKTIFNGSVEEFKAYCVDPPEDVE